MRVPLRTPSSRAVAVSATGAALGLCLMMASPVLLSGCGGSSGSITTHGSGVVGLGRASVLLGTYKSTQTLEGGQIGEVVIQFAPGATSETLTGSYTIRVLSLRPSGKNDIVYFASGTVAGNILANGDLNLVSTADDAARSQAAPSAHASSRQSIGSGLSVPYFVYVQTVIALINHALYTVNDNGATLTNGATGASFSRYQSAPLPATTPAVTLDGTWSGGTAPSTGLQLTNPLIVGPDNSDNPIPGLPLFGIALNYSRSSATTHATLSSAQLGETAVADGVHIYSQYDANIPANFAGVSSVSAGQYFVVGSGKLPAGAGSLTIPGVPVPVSLAGRGFLFEAGGGDDGSDKFQLGTLYVQLTDGEAAFAAYKQVHVNIDPQTASAYVAVGNFRILKGGGTTPPSTATPTPTPTPTPTSSPSPGSVTGGAVDLIYSDVNGIFRTSPSFVGGSISASTSFPSGGTIPTIAIEADQSAGTGAGNGVQRHLVLAYKGVAPTSTQPLPLVSPGTTGASLFYYETPPGANAVTRYYRATGGTVSLVGVNGRQVTLRVSHATMTGYKPNDDPTPVASGSFTLDATLTVTVNSL